MRNLQNRGRAMEELPLMEALHVQVREVGREPSEVQSYGGAGPGEI